PKSERENIAYLLSVMRDVSAPFGVVDPGKPNIAATRWRSVIDMTRKIYFFESTISPNIVWVDLHRLDFRAGASVRKLDLVKQKDYVGDVSNKFSVAKPFVFLTPKM
ncbi:MAG: linear amide C-N hydrolase, partial [Deltaproteobacteria bacterium]|nr:linear amide C-N hydrolase [Deltaproteobacteria bacterium]